MIFFMFFCFCGFLFIFVPYKFIIKKMKQMSKFFQHNRQAICCMALCLIGTVAFAETDVLNSISTSLKGIVENVVNLLRIVLGLGALVTLVIVVFKIFKGEREAAEKIAWWVAGLTIGFVLLSVVKGLI